MSDASLSWVASLFYDTDHIHCCSSPRTPPEHDDTKEFANLTVNDLIRVETLGMGGFGRVELVRKKSLFLMGILFFILSLSLTLQRSSFAKIPAEHLL